MKTFEICLQGGVLSDWEVWPARQPLGGGGQDRGLSVAEAVSTQLPGRGRHVPGETHTASVPDHAAGGTRWVRAGGWVGGWEGSDGAL